MCGIAGIWRHEGRVETSELERMTRLMLHRGPDDSGHVFFDSSDGRARRAASPECDLALGHRRLSILDLSERGQQPMGAARGHLWITYNGEVYNYVELRRELEELGDRFETETDTEVILHAYDRWGEDCVGRFNGMWAFAIWDRRSRKLFCARDRFGIKPFFYTQRKGLFAFGSEIKALISLHDVPASPNVAVIHDYLTLKLSDHTDETFYQEVRRLPAAHKMSVDAEGRVRVERYWDVTPNEAIEWSQSDAEDSVRRFYELLRDSIRLRLRSDVRIGTCLSGGLDSSAIVMLANSLMFDEQAVPLELRGETQQTFSACFDDANFDERPFIERVIDATGAQSHRVFPGASGFWDDLDTLLWHMDEPFHSTSQYAQFCVMRLAGEHSVKVTLDGQGADEMLAGYPGYYGVFLSTLIRRGAWKNAVRQAKVLVSQEGRGRGVAELMLKAGFGLAPPGLAAFARSTASGLFPGLAPEARAREAVAPGLLSDHAERRHELNRDRSAASANLGRRLYADLFTYSLPALLRYEDRNSMAHSIESRTPMLDYRLVEHCLSIPALGKIRDGWTKWTLREAMRETLPPAITGRTDKMGFVTPELVWLRSQRDRVMDTLGGELQSEGLLRSSTVRETAEQALDSTSGSPYYTDVFRWLVVELWMRQMDKAKHVP